MKTIITISIILLGCIVAYTISRAFFRKMAKEDYSYRHVQSCFIISIFSWLSVFALMIVLIIIKFEDLKQSKKKPNKWLSLLIPIIYLTLK